VETLASARRLRGQLRVAPSVNILGSFFPAWLICIVVGVVLTILTRRVFVAMKIASDVGPPALIYPCLAGVWIFATWFLLFGG
jgi:YtcA-like protein